MLLQELDPHFAVYPCTYRTVSNCNLWMVREGEGVVLERSPEEQLGKGAAPPCPFLSGGRRQDAHEKKSKHDYGQGLPHNLEFAFDPTHPLLCTLHTQIEWSDLKLLLAYRPRLQQSLAVHVRSALGERVCQYPHLWAPGTDSMKASAFFFSLEGIVAG